MPGWLIAALALVGVVHSGRCQCGHPFTAHEHYRRGRDCSWAVRNPDHEREHLAPLVRCPCTRYRPTWRRA